MKNVTSKTSFPNFQLMRLSEKLQIKKIEVTRKARLDHLETDLLDKNLLLNCIFRFDQIHNNRRYESGITLLCFASPT
jgi:hypothetical protein